MINNPQKYMLSDNRANKSSYFCGKLRRSFHSHKNIEASFMFLARLFVSLHS